MSPISSLVNATLYTLDDAVLPSATWVLELLDNCEHLEREVGIAIKETEISKFQDEVAQPFITLLKKNISSRFASNDIISALSIFDPKVSKLAYKAMAMKQ